MLIYVSKVHWFSLLFSISCVVLFCYVIFVTEIFSQVSSITPIISNNAKLQRFKRSKRFFKALKVFFSVIFNYFSSKLLLPFAFCDGLRAGFF